MADGDRPVDLPHDRLELIAVIEPEGLGDRPHFLVRLDERVAVGPKAGHAGGELAAVLHVEQHPRNQPRHAVDVARDRGE